MPAALMDAAERLMKENGLETLTEKRVAALVGVSESMVPYYFGDRDGLIYAVVDRFLSFVDDRMQSLLAIDAGAPDASLRFAKTMIEAQYTRPWVARVITVEQQSYAESSIWKWYSARRGPRSLLQLREALCRMAHLRYGRVINDEIHAGRCALSLFCMTSGVLSMHTLSEPIGIPLRDVWELPWLTHVADLIDFHIYLVVGGHWSGRLSDAAALSV